MIVFALVLALVDAVVISQIDYWGIVPVLFSAIVYLFRDQARLLEMVAAAAAYGFVLSIFLPATYGFTITMALVISTTISLSIWKWVRETRIRMKLRGYDAVIIITTFTVVYWTISSVESLTTTMPSSLAIFVLWSTVANLALALGISFINQRITHHG